MAYSAWAFALCLMAASRASPSPVTITPSQSPPPTATRLPTPTPRPPFATYGYPWTEILTVFEREGYALNGNILIQQEAANRAVFVYDWASGEITAVSVSSAGVEANGPSGAFGIGQGFAALSSDGRYVALADNLVPNDTNEQIDIFLRDMESQITTRVSVSSSGRQLDGGSVTPAISPKGRCIAFQTRASDVVPSSSTRRASGSPAWVIHDRSLGTTEALPFGRGGEVAISSDCLWVAHVRGQLSLYDQSSGEVTVIAITGGPPGAFGMSDDGRFIAFTAADVMASTSPDIVDDNDVEDVFFFDRERDEIRIISASVTGEIGNGQSQLRSFSPDGQFVGFSSFASNLDPEGLNCRGDEFIYKVDGSVITRIVDQAREEPEKITYLAGPITMVDDQQQAIWVENRSEYVPCHIVTTGSIVKLYVGDGAQLRREFYGTAAGSPIDISFDDLRAGSYVSVRFAGVMPGPMEIDDVKLIVDIYVDGQPRKD